MSWEEFSIHHYMLDRMMSGGSGWAWHQCQKGGGLRFLSLHAATQQLGGNNALLMKKLSLATLTTAQGPERIRTMAASASVLSNLFTSFSTSGDSMYCDRDRDMQVR